MDPKREALLGDSRQLAGICRENSWLKQPSFIQAAEVVLK